MKPFRWNLQKSEQLGTLIEGERSATYPEFPEELRTVCAKVLAQSEDGLMVFVGRSPESLFDYLSGIFSDSPRLEDLVHLNLSNRYESIDDLQKQNFNTANALNDHLSECGLLPEMILARKRMTVFIDLVARGGTFGILAHHLIQLASRQNLSVREMKRKIAFRGITMQTKTSPNTWRWQQNTPWVKELEITNIKNISIPYRLWDYLGNMQDKVTLPNRPQDWATDTMLEPPREEKNLQALRRAYDLFNLGHAEKKPFAECLSQQPTIREPWLRHLILDLKK